MRAFRFSPPGGGEVRHGLEEAGAVVELDAPPWAPHRRTGRTFAVGEGIGGLRNHVKRP